jgi:GntR family transcriptional regulator
MWPARWEEVQVQIHVNPSDELPIYRQIIRQVTDAIAGGRLAPGEQLPSHRDLAMQLVIAPLTVKKAYDELERAGLIETQRGRGTFIGERPPRPDAVERKERLRDAARRLLTQAALTDTPFEEVMELLAEMREETER